MTKALRNIFISGFLATALAACGGGGGGGDDSSAGGGGSNTGGSGTPPPTVSDVAITKLAGSWFGTFDAGSVVSLTLTFDATGTNITVNEVNGTPSDLTGTVTKDGPTSFRFSVSNPDKSVTNSGVLLTDQTPAYLIFVSDSTTPREFGVLQKDANPPLQSHTQTDINGSWAGYTAAVGAELKSIQPNVSNADCAPAAASAPSGPSACKATLSDRSRSVPAFTLADPLGRWQDTNYTDTPQSGAAQNGTTQAYISQDKKFIGVWACASPASFPASCDYSAWTKK